MQTTPVFDVRQPRTQALVAVLGALLLGLAAGAAVAFGPFWLGFVALLALAAGYALLVNIGAGLAAVVMIATVLPFSTLPFRAIVTPALLSLALLAVSAVWVLRVLLRPDQHLILTPLGLPLFGFYGITLFAFLLGSGLSPTTLQLHNYFKFSVAVFFFYTVVNCVQTRAQARLLLRLFIGGGALSAFIGLVLWALPNQTALQLLLALGRIGYPDSGRVLRFVEDDVNGVERAIGLSVDPNSFGGMLALVGALAITQIVAEKPVLPRAWIIVASGMIAVATLLTQSRAALGGLIVAVVYVATLRYRRLWWAIFLAGGAAAFLLIGLGLGEAFVERVTQGVQFRDQANQMRLAEFNNAVAVIAAYPWFGIGFGGAPDLDLVAGVSSIYLSIAQRTGLIGLFVFGTVMTYFFVLTVRALRQATRNDDGEAAAWLVSLQAAVASALAVGLLDHYFFNIEFSHMAALLWGVVGLAMAVQRLVGEPGEALTPGPSPTAVGEG